MAFCRTVMLFGVFLAVAGKTAPNRTLPVADEDIIFEIGFDDSSTTADLAVGEPESIRRFGKLKFVKGLTGKALLCGKDGAKIRFRRKGNIDFDNPGCLVFWIKPLQWRKSTGNPRILFFGTECAKGFFGVQTANGPKKLSPLERKLIVRLMFFKEIPDMDLRSPAIGLAADNTWNLLAVGWRRDRIFLSLNAGPYVSRKILKGFLANAVFARDDFSIGSDKQDNYLLDEFRIYKRMLTRDELRKIYRHRKRDLK